MKRSDTLFRHKAALLYDTGASIREMVYLITAWTNSPVIDFRVYADMGICERVGTWVEQDCKEGKWELIDTMHRRAGNNDITFDAGMQTREMYDYSLDELIYLHDEIEKIYKYEMKNSK